MDTDIRPTTNSTVGTNFPLPSADLESLGFRKSQIDRLTKLIERHIAEGRYPGCHIKASAMRSPNRKRARRRTTRCGCSTPTPRW